MLNIRFPRLLPVTITALAALLLIKILVLMAGQPSDSAASPSLVSGVAVVSPANAASPEAAAAPATPSSSAPAAPPPEPASSQIAPAQTAPLQTAPLQTAPLQTAAATAPAAPASGGMPPAPAADAAAPADTPGMSDSEKALLVDLRQRRRELDARESGLSTREAMLVAAEHRLSTRIDELTALQAKLEALDKARVEREEANWRGLVKIYEDMKPRDAAAIFNGLDMNVLLQVLDRMKESKSAPVLAAMQPDKARVATAKLAEMRLKNNTIGG